MNQLCLSKYCTCNHAINPPSKNPTERSAGRRSEWRRENGDLISLRFAMNWMP